MKEINGKFRNSSPTNASLLEGVFLRGLDKTRFAFCDIEDLSLLFEFMLFSFLLNLQEDSYKSEVLVENDLRVNFIKKSFLFSFFSSASIRRA